MKSRTLFSFLLFFTLAAGGCIGKNDKAMSENDLDAARNFIQAALNGDYDLAKTYMLQDSLNLEDLNTAVRLSQRFTPEEKRRYREATIRIHERRLVDDSTSVISYSNSYRQRVDSLLVIKKGERWLVDFKYIFNHKADSLP